MLIPQPTALEMRTAMRFLKKTILTCSIVRSLTIVGSTEGFHFKSLHEILRESECWITCNHISEREFIREFEYITGGLTDRRPEISKKLLGMNNDFPRGAGSCGEL
jgi:hypothetical protein